MERIRSFRRAAFGCALLVAALPPLAFAGALETANVIGPLRIEDHQWPNIRRQLSVAKQLGVDAVSTDVWWGKVEGAGDQQFDWSFYDRLVGEIEAAGLRWVPILSFHKCGTNVGDDCFEPIPAWIWTHFPGTPGDHLKYQSENGNTSVEVVTLWADDLVMPEYREFMEAFEDHFGEKAAIIDEINISTGTAGELRYPSYNAHDSYQYPHRGYFQAYGPRAVAAFRDYVLARYGNLAGVNQAWGTRLSDVGEIGPPGDADGFVQRKDYVNTEYGRTFVDFLNQALIDHGIRMIDTADAAFNDDFAEIAFGLKIPGIHWRINDPDTPRIAEITTGLIRTSIDFQSDATARGYAPLIGVWSHYNDHPRGVVLHFTALELANGRDTNLNAHSAAEDLVGWVAAGAAAQGVEIKGENALQAEIRHDGGWDRIEAAFRDHAYTGFSALRLAEIADHPVARERYRQMIENRPAGPCLLPSMTVRGTHNNWGTTPMTCDPASGEWRAEVSFSDATPHALKFDVFGDWRDNFGDNDGDGIGDPFGANIPVPDGAGSYQVRFDGETRAYEIVADGNGPACRFPSLAVRGTHNAWGVAPMACDGGVWQRAVTFTGSFDERFKFDVHGDWSDNYGDNNSDGIGDFFGADIPIPAGPGTYRITFDDDTRAYTVTKQ